MRRGLLTAGLVLLAGLAALPAAGAAAGSEPDDGPAFLVDRFVVSYEEVHRDHPDLGGLLPLAVRLGRLDSGFVAPRPGVPETVVSIGAGGDALPYHASAIGTITRRVAARIREEGLLGVYVAPDPAQIDIEQVRDLRPDGERELRIVIRTARVRAMRTIARGDRIDGEWKIDNRVHRRILEGSPLQPTGSAMDGESDLVRGEVLDDYLFRLNRHPGRRVDASLAPSGDGSGANIDFLVSEAKPWYVYAQTSNTGSDSTSEWQTRLGYVNNQATDRDDIFGFEYTNGGTRLHSVSLSYEAPWFSKRRAWWWGPPSDGPGWLSWIDRSKLPWFGSEGTRWRVWGSYTTYSAKQVSGVDDVDGEDWEVGARILHTAYQRHAFFLDVFGGLRMRGVEVDNQEDISTASQFLLIPQIGIQTERVNEVSSFFGDVILEGNIGSKNSCRSDVPASPTTCVDGLGLADVDSRYAVVRVNMGLSQYLEPLLNPVGWEDPSTRWSSTLAHELHLSARGQYAFDYRLIPQVKEVVGGLYSVRGYEQSTASGDHVGIATLEYRYHIPHSLPISREPIALPFLGNFRLTPQQVYGRPDWDLILRGFTDIGLTHRNKRPDTSRERQEFLVGAGVGLELVVRNNLRARVDWATALRDSKDPVDRVDAGDHQVHLLFSVMY